MSRTIFTEKKSWKVWRSYSELSDKFYPAWYLQHRQHLTAQIVLTLCVVKHSPCKMNHTKHSRDLRFGLFVIFVLSMVQIKFLKKCFICSLQEQKGRLEVMV